MGACGSADRLTPQEKEEQLKEQDQSTKIDKVNQRSADLENQIKKLLLLGAGESGKSTLFKQMTKLWGEGFSEADRAVFVRTVHNNILEAIKTLCIQTESKFEGVTASFKVLPANEVHKEYFKTLKIDEQKITPEIGQTIEALWQDPGIKAVYEYRNRYQLIDSAAYFFNRIRDISAPNYRPIDDDIFRCRVRTTGIVQLSFAIDNNKFMMVDVGGQRNERKKWIHCFEGVTAVIFVAAVSEYDQVLFEDQSTNRMLEALNLFDEICNSKYFNNTSMVLFLNKSDLFEEKITKVNITCCFPEYDGPQKREEALQYIAKQFLEKNKSRQKEVYPHITCATNTDNIEHVFLAVKDIIIRRSLREGGLL